MPKPLKPIKFYVYNPRPDKMMPFAGKAHPENLKFFEKKTLIQLPFFIMS